MVPFWEWESSSSRRRRSFVGAPHAPPRVPHLYLGRVAPRFSLPPSGSAGTPTPRVRERASTFLPRCSLHSRRGMPATSLAAVVRRRLRWAAFDLLNAVSTRHELSARPNPPAAAAASPSPSPTPRPLVCGSPHHPPRAHGHHHHHHLHPTRSPAAKKTPFPASPRGRCSERVGRVGGHCKCLSEGRELGDAQAAS